MKKVKFEINNEKSDKFIFTRNNLKDWFYLSINMVEKKI